MSLSLFSLSLFSLFTLHFPSFSHSLSPSLSSLSLQAEWTPVGLSSASLSAPSRCEAPFVVTFSPSSTSSYEAFLFGGLFNVPSNSSLAKNNAGGEGESGEGESEGEGGEGGNVGDSLQRRRRRRLMEVTDDKERDKEGVKEGQQGGQKGGHNWTLKGSEGSSTSSGANDDVLSPSSSGSAGGSGSGSGGSSGNSGSAHIGISSGSGSGSGGDNKSNEKSSSSSSSATNNNNDQGGFEGCSDSTCVVGMNDVYSFTLLSNAYSNPIGQWNLITLNAPFLPRYSATAALSTLLNPTISPHVVLYAGVSAVNSQFLDDIWDFDVESAEFTAIRLPSFQPLALVQEAPSPRAFTHTRLMSISLDLLQAAASLSSPLATFSLREYTASVVASNSLSPSSLLVVFGGRSDPSTPYSTEGPWTQPFNGGINSTDTHDLADLWFYSYSEDVWFRVGNLTCAGNQTLQCSDSTSLDDLSDGQLSTQIALAQSLLTEQVEPSNLETILTNLSSVLTDLKNLYEEPLEAAFLSNSSLVTNNNSTCGLYCDNLTEIAAPFVDVPKGCSIGGVSTSANTTGCPFYSSTSGGYNVQFQQQRPPNLEGAATAVLTTVNSGISRSISFQLGGFSCARAASFQGDLFSGETFSSTCINNTMYALDAFGSSLIWWEMTPSPGSSSSYYWPSPRAYAAMAIDSAPSRPLLYVFGGAYFQENSWIYYNDLYVFDILGVTWTQVSVTTLLPTAVRSPRLIVIPGQPQPETVSEASTLVLFGGCGPFSMAVNQMYILQLNAMVGVNNLLTKGTGTTNATAGQWSYFIIAAVDSISAASPTVLAYATGLAPYFSVSWTVYDDMHSIMYPPPPFTTIYDLNNGQYLLNYTATYGRYLVCNVYFSSPAYPSTSLIPGSPFLITIAPGAPKGSASNALYNNFTTVAKGGVVTMVVQVNDQYDNPVVGANSSLPSFLLYVADVSSSQSLSSDTIISTSWMSVSGFSVIDNGDSTFSLTYTVPTLWNYYYLFVLLGEQQIIGSPFLVQALNSLLLPNNIKIAFLTLSIIVGAFIALAMACVIVNRNNPVIRAGSPLFMSLICFGALLCIISVPVYAYLSPVNCRLFPFLLTTGYIICLGSMFIKAYRVLLIFGNSPKTIISDNLSDSHMLLLVFLLLCAESIINLVWLIGSPLTLNTLYLSSTPHLTYQQCGGPHSSDFAAASVAFNCLVAIWGVYLAIRIRHVPQAFNESRLMGSALYNLAICLVIVIPLTWTASNAQSTYVNFIFPATFILWCAGLTVALTVVARLWYCLYPPPPTFFDTMPDASGVTVQGVKGKSTRDTSTNNNVSTSALPSLLPSSSVSELPTKSVSQVLEIQPISHDIVDGTDNSGLTQSIPTSNSYSESNGSLSYEDRTPSLFLHPPHLTTASLSVHD